MRFLSITLGSVLFVFGAAAGCGSISVGSGGSGGSTGSIGSGATGTACLPNGAQCYSATEPCCDGAGCNEGTCGPCYSQFPFTQCMCGGVAVGPQNGCTVGVSCGLDAGATDAGDGGACQCMQQTQSLPCD